MDRTLRWTLLGPLTLLVFLLLLGSPLGAQAADPGREAFFSFLGGLVGGEWSAEGAWPDGSPFRQRQTYSWDLDRTIVLVRSSAPGEDGEWVARNHGIRAWDAVAGEGRFWEFDRFGGITTGRAWVADGALNYQYEYEVEGRRQVLRESLRPRGARTYEYRLGVVEGEAVAQVLMEATLTARAPDSR